MQDKEMGGWGEKVKRSPASDLERSAPSAEAALQGHLGPRRGGPSRAPRRARRILNTKEPPGHTTRSREGRRGRRPSAPRAPTAGEAAGRGGHRRLRPDLPPSAPELAAPPAPLHFPLSTWTWDPRGDGRAELGRKRRAMAGSAGVPPQPQPQAGPGLPGRNGSRAAPAAARAPPARARPTRGRGSRRREGGGGGTIT